MKKSILIILACVIGICAFAKTESELTTEYNAIAAADETALFAAQRKFADDNSKELLALFEAWKSTDEAKLNYAGLEQKYKSDPVMLKQRHTLRMIFAKLYDLYYAQMDASDLVLCRLGSGYVKNVKPNSWYENIKSAGFVVEGAELNGYERCFLAHQFGDEEFLKAVPVSVGMQFKEKYLDVVLLGLIQAQDALAAKQKCNEIENWLINNKEFGGRLTHVQAVGRVLTARVAESKIIGN